MVHFNPDSWVWWQFHGKEKGWFNLDEKMIKLHSRMDYIAEDEKEKKVFSLNVLYEMFNLFCFSACQFILFVEIYAKCQFYLIEIIL